jgi:hypothetical protein
MLFGRKNKTEKPVFKMANSADMKEGVEFVAHPILPLSRQK